MSQPWSPPAWMYRTSRPTDNGYFENMTRIIFQGGLKWSVIDGKWPAFRHAFNDFSIDAVVNYDATDVERLIADAGIVRNRAKIEATINNAKCFQRLIRTHGSFRRYLDTLDKSDNYAHAVKELATQFARLGPASARLFLYAVGEPIAHEC